MLMLFRVHNIPLVYCRHYLFSIYVVAANGELRLPNSIGLESYGITCAGDSQQLSSICASTKELDLSGNQIKDWLEVLCYFDYLHICRAFAIYN